METSWEHESNSMVGVVGGEAAARSSPSDGVIVKHRIQPFTYQTDLWQLGMLIETAAAVLCVSCADVAITSFADCLMAGRFATAALAQAS